MKASAAPLTRPLRARPLPPGERARHVVLSSLVIQLKFEETAR